MIKKYLHNAIVKNAGWLIFSKIIQMLLSLFVGIFTARYLQPANFGLINYAAAYTAFFMAFCTLGINSILVKEFIDNPDDEGKIIGSTLLLRAVSSFLSALTIICIVAFIDYDEPTTIAVTVLSTIGLFFHIFDTFSYWFHSKLKSNVNAVATLVAYVITSAYKILLLILGKDVTWFAFATALDYICYGIILFFCYKRYGGKKLSFSKSVSKNLLSKSVHFILPTLMIAIYGYTDKFMLKQMCGDEEVGYYSIATTICSMWVFVLHAIIDSVNPSIMELHKTDKNQFEKRNRILYAIVFYISIFIAVIFTLFGDIAIQILYGSDYLPSANPLRIVTWYTAFSFLGVARNAWIVCENKQKYLKYIYVSAAISNILLNLIFIPIWKDSGAALASLITQVLTTMVLPFFIKPLRRNSVLMLEGILFRKIK